MVKITAAEFGVFDELTDLTDLTEPIVFDEILELEAEITSEISASRISVQDVADIALNKLPIMYVCDPLNNSYAETLFNAILKRFDWGLRPRFSKRFRRCFPIRTVEA